VDTTLRFLIEQVGEVEQSPGSEARLEEDFLKRRTVGNVIEGLGIVAFRASPVWVLAALADVSGLGRRLIPEIAAALKAQGLIEGETNFTSVDQLLDALERTSARLATTINTPPLDVAALRSEWQAIRDDARGLAPERLPNPAALIGLWTSLQAEAERQGTSTFETSSMVALSTLRAVPQGARWLGASAATGAARTGQIFAEGLLEHYRTTLADVRQVGYTAYARRQLTPYFRAAVSQFAPGKTTLTGRIIDRGTGTST
jgi:hypothetical protein